MDRGAWQTTVHRVTKSQTWLRRLTVHACTFLTLLWELNEVKWIRKLLFRNRFNSSGDSLKQWDKIRHSLLLSCVKVYVGGPWYSVLSLLYSKQASTSFAKMAESFFQAPVGRRDWKKRKGNMCEHTVFKGRFPEATTQHFQAHIIGLNWTSRETENYSLCSEWPCTQPMPYNRKAEQQWETTTFCHSINHSFWLIKNSVFMNILLSSLFMLKA